MLKIAFTLPEEITQYIGDVRFKLVNKDILKFMLSICDELPFKQRPILHALVHPLFLVVTSCPSTGTVRKFMGVQILDSSK